MGDLGKAARMGRQASAFGLSLAEFRALQKRRIDAETGLQGYTKQQRLEIAARRLSITPGELKTLRVALANTAVVKHSERVRSVARLIVSLRPTSEPSRVKSDASAELRRPKANAGPSATGNWKADRTVYLTDWGDVVHVDRDCPGLWGFRVRSEPPPVIHQVTLRDRRCGGRRGCKKCIGSRWSGHGLQQLANVINSLHGNRRVTIPPNPSARRLGRQNRVVVKSSDFRTPQAYPQGLSKRQRRIFRELKEAEHLGISREVLLRRKEGRNASDTDSRAPKSGSPTRRTVPPKSATPQQPGRQRPVQSGNRATVSPHPAQAGERVSEPTIADAAWDGGWDGGWEEAIEQGELLERWILDRDDYAEDPTQLGSIELD